jgi:apolipoprotein N-acyltransferase
MMPPRANGKIVDETREGSPMKAGSALMPQTPQASPKLSAHLSPLPSVPMPWLALPALSGVLLWLCFYPLGWGFLGWAALVPLLFLVHLEARPWQIYLGSFIGGCLFYWSALSWMTVADYRMVYLWGLLATYCALYFPVALFLIRRLERVTFWPLTITVPLVWTGLEFLRSFFGTGFAWYFLGHSQHHYLPVIQVADLGGVYVISFVMAAVNGWCAECLIAIPEMSATFRPAQAAQRATRRFGLAVLALTTAMLVYGGWRLSQDRFLAGPRVALLQGNLDQRFRNEATGVNDRAVRTRQEIYKYYLAMCGQAINQIPAPDLLVWPETSFPFPWIELPQDLNKMPLEAREEAREDARLLQKIVRDVARETKTSHLFGLNTNVVNEAGRALPYNSALLISRDGNTGGRYDKIHRVPFGEYVPLREWLFFAKNLVPYDAEYGVQPGEKLTRFALGDFHFGVLICYEDTDPFLARQYGRDGSDGPAVDFLLNISNDGWFDGSRQHAEHLAISRFRAIETRRAVARAVNMGISAVIDGNGRVLEPKQLAEAGDMKIWGIEPETHGGVSDLPEGKWRDFTKVHGILTAAIPIDNRFSLYAWTGDWLPLGCWLLVGCVWVWRKKNTVFGVTS